MRVLYISEVQWLSQPSRKHHIVRRFPRDWDVVFISPINAKRGENSFRLKKDPDHPHVRYVSMALPKPDSTAAVVRAATELLALTGLHKLRSAIRSFRPDVIVTSYIWAAPVVPFAQRLGIPVIYDCNDLHPDFYPARARAAERAFRDLVSAANEIVASSTNLRDVCGRGVVIGNGVDLDTFAGRGSHPRPESLAVSALAGRRRLAAYVGSINKRLDFAILEALLTALPDDAGLVCIGRVYDAVRADVEKLADRYADRVLFTGLVPYDKLPEYLSHTLVGIAPFVLDERTRAINPNKLYMYAAMEQNIVTTPFSDEVTQYGALIHVTADADEFAARTIEALGDDERRRAVRDRIAVPNSWDERAGAFAGIISRLADRGGVQ